MAVLLVGDEERRREVEHAKRELRAFRKKHGADNWVLLGKVFNAHTGLETDVWWDSETDRYAMCRTDHYKDAILDNNNAEAIATQNSRAKDIQKVASIPMGVFWDKFAPALVKGDQAHVNRLLNDPDYAKLRTWKGKL